MFTHFTIPV